MPLLEGVDNQVLAVFTVVVATMAGAVVHSCRRPSRRLVVAVGAARMPHYLFMQDRATLDDCAICLDAVAFPISTNCGHTFCGGCLVAYFEHSRNARGLVTCPMCRREITLLERRGWTAEEAQSQEGAQRQEALNACVRACVRGCPTAQQLRD